MLEGEQLAAFLEARLGKLTASSMSKAMAYRKDGKPMAERTQLMKEILAERLVGANARHFVSDAMRHGLEYEDDAKLAYEAATGDLVLPSRTIDHPRIDMLAATPDGFLDGGRLLEVKAPTTATFLEWVILGVVPDEHKAQMCCQAACTGRRHIVFAAFDPRLPTKQQLFIRDYKPTDEEITKVEAAAQTFLTELDRMWEMFHERAA